MHRIPYALLVAIVFAMATRQVSAQPSSMPPPVPIAPRIVAEDFRKAPPKLFQTEQCPWNASQGITMAAGSVLTMKIDARPIGTMGITLAIPEEVKDCEFSLQATLTTGERASVLIRQRFEANGLQRNAHITVQPPAMANPSEITAVRSMALAEPLDGEWAMRVRYGHIHLEQNGHLLLVGHAPVSLENLSSVSVVVGAGKILVADAKLKFDAPLVVSDPQKFSEANKLRMHATTLLTEQKHVEAIKVLRELHSLYLASVGNDHPETTTSHQDLAVALGNAGKLQESIPILREALESRGRVLGSDHPLTALTARNLGNQMQMVADYTKSLELARETLRIAELNYGGTDPRALEEGIQVASLLQLVGQHARSEDLLARILAGCQAGIGERHPVYGKALAYFAKSLSERGEKVESRKQYEAACKVFRANLPGSTIDLADSLRSLSDVQVSLGSIQEAERSADACLEVLRKESIPDNVRIAEALMTKGNIETGRGKVDQAREYFLQSIELLESTLGKSHERVATQWMAIGHADFQQGRFPEALQSYDRAFEIFARNGNAIAKARILDSIASAKRHLGNREEALRDGGSALQILHSAGLANDSLAARLHDTMAKTLMEKEDYAQARIHQEAAIAILRKVQPPAVHAMAVSQVDLGLILAQLGDHSKGQALLRAVIEARKDDRLREARLNVASARRYLAMSLSASGQQDLARNELRAAYVEFRELYGAKHPLTLSCQSQLGAADNDPAKKKEALEAALRSVEVAHGPQHPQALVARLNLAAAYLETGGFDQAVTHYEFVLNAEKDTPAQDSAQSASTRMMLGLSYLGMQDYSAAMRQLGSGFDQQWKKTLTDFDHLSEAEAYGKAAELGNVASFVFSASRRAEDATDLQRYEPFWRARALTSREFTDRRRVALVSKEGQDVSKRLREVREAIAKGMVTDQEMPSASTGLMALTAEKERLQRRLGELVIANRKSDKPALLGPLDLAQKLPPDVAVVDIVNSIHWDYQGGKLQSASRYDAFVIRNPSSGVNAVTMVPLGSSPEIDLAVISWRGELLLPLFQSKAKEVTPAAWGAPESKGAKYLQANLWGPIEASLSGCKSVLIVPSGALTQLPWGALPGKKTDSYLIEDYATAVLVYAQQALDVLQQDPVINASTFVASTLPVSVQQGATKRGQQAPEVVPLFPPDLKVNSASDPKARLIIVEGYAASKDRICLQLPASRYIHLEAHGYVLTGNLLRRPASIPNPNELLYSGVRNSKRETMAERNPLAMTGITFEPDGRLIQRLSLGTSPILSGEEIAGMNLANTELVVLESCETGLGRIAANGEGAFSVQRAFGLAGVRSVVGTLWIVQLGPSRILMQEFYRNLHDKDMSKLEALRQAQIRVMHDLMVPNKVFQSPDKSRVAPYYWAGYSLSGDWR